MLKLLWTHYVLNGFNYHLETSAHVLPLRNLIQPLLVILKDDGVDMKAKPVLPHMDHHAHSSSYETQLSESVYVSAISSLSLPAAHRPSRDALFSRSFTVYHFPISSPMTWCGFFVSLVSAWLSEESPRLQQGQLETTDAVHEPSCWTTCLNISPSSLPHVILICM